MKRQLTLIFHFYKPIAVLSLIFTGLSLFSFMKVGLVHLNIPLMIKLSGYLLTVSYQYLFASKSYFYYRNAGYGARQMYARVFSLDFAFYISLMVISYSVGYGFKA